MLCGEQTIGAAGAVGALAADDSGLTIAKNAGAGTYDITFPKAIAAKLLCQLVSPAGTVKIVNTVAINAAAGTAQIVTSAPGGAATNPASGDVIHLLLLLDQRSDN
jgi:hypothetical protein